MTECVEIQAQIQDYIEEKLEPEHLESFVNHISTCDDCKEELSVYYTLYQGLRQLDQDDEEVKELRDPDGALERTILNSIYLVRRFHFVTTLRYIVTTVAFWCVIVAVLMQIRIFFDLGIL